MNREDNGGLPVSPTTTVASTSPINIALTSAFRSRPFDGSHAARFIQNIDDYAELESWDAKRCVLTVIVNTVDGLKGEVRALPGATDRNWVVFKKEFLKHFKYLDQAAKYSIADLNNCQQSDKAFVHYYRQFSEIFNELMSREKVYEHERMSRLLAGTRRELRQTLMKDHYHKATVEKLVEAAIKHEALEQEIAEFDNPAAGTAPAVSPAPKPASPTDTVSSLTEELERLRLHSVRLEQELNKVKRHAPGPSPFTPPTRYPTGCTWCGNSSHRKDQCDDLKKAVAAGVVKLQDWRILFSDGTPLPRNSNGLRENLTPEQIARYAHVNVSLYHITTDTPRVASDDVATVAITTVEGDDVVTPPTGWTCPVYDAEVNSVKRSPVEELLKDDGKRVRFEDEEVDQMGLQSQPESVKRSRLKSKALEEVNAEDIANRLLDSDFTVSLRDILSVSPKLLKVVMDQIRQRRVAEVNFAHLEEEYECLVNSIEAISDPDGLNEEYLRKLYSSATPSTRARIGDETLECWLDEGAEISVMPLRTVQRLNLPIDTHCRMNMVTANSSSNALVGVCHDVEVEIGGVKARTPIFVQAKANFELLLGRPYTRLVRAKFTSLDNGEQWAKIQEPRGDREVQFKCCDANSPRNRGVPSTNGAKVSSIQVNDLVLPDGLEEDESVVAVVEFETEVDMLLKAGALPGDRIEFVNVNATRYKPVAKKVRPVATSLPDGVRPFEMKSPQAPLLSRRLTSERIASLKFGDMLTPEEKQLFLEMLLRHDKVFAFDAAERGCLLPESGSPHIIYTVPHTPWKFRPLRFAQKETEEIIEVLKDRLKSGVLEPCCGPYANRWFCVKKKSGGYRFIQDLQPLNKVTIRDSAGPPVVDEFAESFSGCPIYTITDLFSGYDQVPLAEQCRDMTAIDTPLGLLRMTRMPQGGTNSVADYQRTMVRILRNHIPMYVGVFIDDIVIKSARLKDETFVSPGIRKFVADHVAKVDEVLEDLEEAGLTIAGEKSSFGVNRIVVVGHVCEENGRSMDAVKVEKIKNWPVPKSVTEVRSFAGLATFYRIFVPKFSERMKPLFDLAKKNSRFKWGVGEQKAFDDIKDAISTDAVLKAPDYEIQFIVSTDASDTGLGAVLSQGDGGKRRPVRFESKLLSSTESRYAPIKRELLGILFALRKFRHYVYGRHFILETDAKPLVWILNSVPEVSDAAISRWLAFIRSFDFTVVHVPGKKNIVPDALSRRPEDTLDGSEKNEETDEFLDTWLGSIHLELSEIESFSHVYFLDAEYDEEHRNIGRFLTDLSVPEGLNVAALTRFKKKAYKFVVRDGHLFLRPRKAEGCPRRVVCDPDTRKRIIAECHDAAWAGHRDVKGTVGKVLERYYWPGVGKDVKNYVQTCEPCQFDSNYREVEPLRPTYTISLWRKIGIDFQYLPRSNNHPYIGVVEAREDLSGWVEARPLKDNKSFRFCEFIMEDILSRYGCVGQFTSDNGEMNAAIVREMLNRYRIQIVFTTAYHPEGNALVERGHSQLVKALARACNNDPDLWPSMLPLALWADRTTAKSTTGISPYELLYGIPCVLPIEEEAMTWATMDWKAPMTTEELLAARILQLERRPSQLDEAARRLRLSREGNKRHFDETHRIRRVPLQEGNLVLMFDSRTFDRNRPRPKFTNKWFGPYLIVKIHENGSCMLAELDGTRLSKTVAANRLKLFKSREEVLDPEEILSRGRDASNGAGGTCEGSRSSDVGNWRMTDADWQKLLDNTACDVCGGLGQENVAVLCDACGTARHTHCMNPQMEAIPEDRWFCGDECLDWWSEHVLTEV